jgi:hypothetical protein
MTIDELTQRQWSYVPILKGKAGEYEALKSLDPRTRERLVPLVVPSAASDDPQPVRDLASTLRAMPMGWGRQGPIILDGEQMPSVAQFADCLTAASQLGWLAIPSTRLTDPGAYHDVVRTTARDGAGLTLRLRRHELDPADLTSQLTEFMKVMGVDPSMIDLVFDLRDVDFMKLGATSLAVLNALRSLPWAADWRHLVLAATGAPASMKEFGVNEISEMPRNEAILFASIAQAKDLRRMPIYSDYAIAHPDPVEDQSGPAINMAASLRYSTEDKVLIVKGVRVRDNGSALFPDLLGRLVARPEFAGRTFSRGDGWIDDAAKRDVGPGNAKKWREAGTSHHLTMITRLFATPAAL